MAKSEMQSNRPADRMADEMPETNANRIAIETRPFLNIRPPTVIFSRLCRTSLLHPFERHIAHAPCPDVQLVNTAASPWTKTRTSTRASENLRSGSG
jgi:hypothetical protein